MVFSILNLAGLPPFLFFGCKVGLLSYLLHANTIQVSCTILALVFIGWLVYGQLVKHFLSTLTPTIGTPVRLTRLPSSLAWVLALFMLSLTTGLFFFEEFTLLVHTLA